MTSSDEESMSSMSSNPSGRRGDQGNQLVVWDFTLAKVHEDTTVEYKDLKEKLIQSCSSWGFQLEEAITTKYLHYQGRLRLNERKRLPEVKALLGYNWIDLSKTSTNAAKKDNFYSYVTKNATHVDGPWTDKSEREILIPKRVLEYINSITLYPWQQQIVDECGKKPDRRQVNILYDPLGAKGKSTIIEVMRRDKIKVLNVPVSSRNTKRLVTNVASWCLTMGKKPCLHERFTMIFDLPRSEVLSEGLYRAIETIKAGQLFDWRYKLTEVLINYPHIWVFTSKMPAADMLSSDGWKFWFINDQNVLEVKQNK